MSSDDSEDDEEEDVPCCICNDGDYMEDDLIVFCDGCDVAVHQQCYGIPNVPKGPWYCARCKAMEEEDEDEVVRRDCTLFFYFVFFPFAFFLLGFGE